jgi:hypothetical protein
MTEDNLSDFIEGFDDEDDQAPTLATQEAANERSNAHIEAYLREFIGDPNAPDHAVMISGVWGIGKSHFVRQMVDRYAREDDQERYVYVSLAGLTTVDDMDAALTVALYPILGTPAAQAAMTLASAALKHFNGDPNIKVRSIANKLGAKLYIFDDLERCAAPLSTALGYINRFVEHAGCHVVIVANEDELLKEPAYRITKEKVVGQTFTFQPVVSGPLEQFIGQVSSERGRNVLAAGIHTLRTRFAQCRLNNLRVLRQAIWDFGRLAEQLTEAHSSNNELMSSILDSFMLLSFEYKAGRLSQAEVALTGSASTFSVLGKGSATDQTWKELRRRYPNSAVDHRVFDGALWTDVLVHGFLDQAALRKACDESRFVAGKDVPSWKRLWDVWSESDDDAAALIADVRAKFKRREYTVPGELMHVVGLHVWMAKSAFTDLTLPEFIVEAKRYVDDLYAAGTIAGGIPLGGSDSFSGLGIQQRETAEFAEIKEYYKAQRDKFQREQLPVDASQLLSELRCNPRAFIEKVCFTNGGNYVYRDIPVLAAMNIQDCAAALVALSGRDQQAVFSSIKERYDHGSLDGTLASERPWLVQLRERLLTIAATRTGFARFRIERMVQWSFSFLLDPTEEAEAAPTADED